MVEFITPRVVAKVRDTFFIDAAGGVLYNFLTLSYFCNHCTCRCILFLSFLCYYRLGGDLGNMFLYVYTC